MDPMRGAVIGADQLLVAESDGLAHADDCRMQRDTNIA